MDSDTLERDEPADDGFDNGQISERDLDEIDAEHMTEQACIPNDVNVAQCVNGLKYQAAQTEFQTVVNAHMDELYERNVHRLEQFVGRQWVV